MILFVIIFITLLFILIFSAQVKFHSNPVLRPEIVQTSVDSAAAGDLLINEKNPVLLTRGNVSGMQKVRSLLRFSYVRAGPTQLLSSASGVTNDARYLVTWTESSSVPAEVDIVHPHMQKTPFRVRLNAGEVLVLPPKWRLEIIGNSVNVYSLRFYDMYSFVRTWFEK